MESKNVSYTSIDLMRFLCAILVIIIHANPLSGAIGYIISVGVARIAVPFFFLTSGYFFVAGCNRSDNYYKKYLFSLVKVYLIWYCIYFVWRYAIGDISFSLKSIILLIREFLFSGYYQLWYMPSLILSITLVYYFIKKDRYNILLIISIVLFLFGIFGDAYSGLINNEIYNKLLNIYGFIFGGTKTGICFAVPLITLGAVINRFNLNNKLKNIRPLAILSFILLLVESYALQFWNFGSARNMMLSLIVFTPFMFIWLLKNSISINYKLSLVFRDLSLSIYCSHALFIMIINKIVEVLNLNKGYNYNLYLFIVVTIMSISFGLIKNHIKNIYDK